MLKRLVVLILFLPAIICSQNYPSRPANYVTDETGTLNSTEQEALNAQLKRFENSTSNQVFIFMTASLKGADITQLCQNIFHEWHIGQQNKNNGLLIAVFKDDHKFRIHTGYGLEGQLPDLLTKRIQDQDMRPHFKEGNYYTGIQAGVDKLIYYTKHAYVPDEGDVRKKPEKSFFTSPLFFVLIPFYALNVVAFLMIFFNLLGKRGRRLSKKSKKMVWIWSLLLLPVPLVGGIIIFIIGFKKDILPPPNNNGYSGTTYSGGSSSYDSSSSWSSSSSSDFGGGGGGDSGGGGSSSSW
jgi:uncharacterized protein